MNRFGAFAVHLGISLVIFAVLGALMVYVWYPDFFFAADGGWEGIRIIALVGLVLGPMLTLIVYRQGKPSLRTDLSIIVMIQITCLIAGTWVVYSQRPLALVYSDGRFFSMSIGDFEEAGVDPAALAALPGRWPKRVAVVLPDDPIEQSELRGSAFREGRPLRTLIDHYQPLTLDALNMDAEAMNPAELSAQDARTGHLPGWLARHGGGLEDYAFFSFATRYHFAYLGVSRADGRLVGLLRTPGPL